MYFLESGKLQIWDPNDGQELLSKKCHDDSIDHIWYIQNNLSLTDGLCVLTVDTLFSSISKAIFQCV